jgi:predicted dehydrogenase
MKTTSAFTRRQFLRTNLAMAMAASTFPNILPASALGQDGAVAPSERIVLGAIGVGDRGRQVLGGFLNQKNCQTVAVCDVKQDVLAKGKALVDARYGNTDCATCSDFRELLARKDVDAVLIASPDHWHVLHALAAVRAGKDLYVEKPLGLSLAEDQALRREVQTRKRIFQFGTQQRSDNKFRLACELVRNGYIGQLKHINIWAPQSIAGGSTRIVPPPANMDYNFWLGPAKYREHTEDLTLNSNWWHVSDFAPGFIAGWGIHPVDIALWGAGDLTSGKVDVSGTGIFPTEGLHDTATAWDLDLQCASGLTMKFASSPRKGNLTEKLGEEWAARYGKIDSHGTAFEGTEGWIKVHRGGISTKKAELLELDQQAFKTKLIRSRDHAGNFLEAVKSRLTTVAPIEDAVKSDALCQVADIAIRLKRKLSFDTKSETFSEDPEANQHLALRPFRAPWKI